MEHLTKDRKLGILTFLVVGVFLLVRAYSPPSACEKIVEFDIDSLDGYPELAYEQRQLRDIYWQCQGDDDDHYDNPV